MARIKKYLINPVDSHHVDSSDRLLLRDLPSAKNVEIMNGFKELDEK
jgi:hypothetical protein